MSFAIHIATDIRREKVNLEVPFSAKPSLDQLRSACESVFAAENGGPFGIGRIQIYDDDAMQWVDLVSTAQLHPFDQLYVFPLDLTHICQQRRELPPPRQVQNPSSRGNYGAEPQQQSQMYQSSQSYPSQPYAHHQQQQPQQRGVDYSRSGNSAPRSGGFGGIAGMGSETSPANISPEEKIKKVFDVLDAQRHGYVSQKEFGSLLAQQGITFTPSIVNEMFQQVGGNDRGSWAYADFVAWTRLYPVTFSALFQRMFLSQKENEMDEVKKAKEASVARLEEQLEVLKRQLADTEAQLRADRAAAAKASEDLHNIRRRRAQDEEEEQALLDKEVSVNHQRAILRKEEGDLEKMAQRRGYTPTPSSGPSRPY